MASDGDDERNDNYAGSRHRNVKQNEAQAEEAVWSEKCIGFWHKDSGRKGSKGQQICTGINIIHINKKPNDAKINLTQTRGIEIIIEEKAFMNDVKLDEDIGSDGVIGHQAPALKSKKAFDNLDQEESLTQNITENFKERIRNINSRIDKYQKNPAAATELFGEVKEMAENQYITGKRLLGYLKPSEKLAQMNSFVKHHMKDVWTWFGDKGGKS